MFSKGNLSEKKRIISQIKRNETVLDMFAGIGYFSLGIAKFSDAKKIYSIEINPESYRYLKENIRLNKLENKIVPILGDCKECKKIGKVDRIIMGLLPSPKDYLGVAIKTIKKNGIIHYHSTFEKNGDCKKLLNEINDIAVEHGFSAKLLKCKKVKSYAPNIDHVVLDVILDHF